LPRFEYRVSDAAPDTPRKSAVEFADGSLADGFFKPALDKIRVPLEFLRALWLSLSVHRVSAWTGDGSV